MEETEETTALLESGIGALKKSFRPIHLKEDVPFKHCIILKSKHNDQTHSSPVEAQMEVVKAMVAAGLDVTVMKATADIKDKVVLLVNPQRDRLVHEIQRLNAERQSFSNPNETLIWERKFGQDDVSGEHLLADRPCWNRGTDKGMMTAEDDYESIKWESARYVTYADEVLAVHRILTGTAEPEVGDDSTGDGEKKMFVGADLRNPDLVCLEDVFPIRDDKSSLEIMDVLNPKVNDDLQPYIGGRDGGWYYLELRYHFGERIAYYFAFMTEYTASLQLPSFGGLALWIIFRIVIGDSVTYFRALSLYGFVIAVIWAPYFLRKWDQKENDLNYEWGLTDWSEQLDPNPQFNWGDKSGPVFENSRAIKNQVNEKFARQAYLRYIKPGKPEGLDPDDFKEMCLDLPGLDSLDTDEKRAEAFDRIDKNHDGAISVEEFVAWIEVEPAINYPLGIMPDNRKQSTVMAVLWNYWELALLFIFLLVAILGFMYWYINAMLAPICEEGDGKSWPTCFNTASPALGTGRWFYCFLQGLTLGIFLDTALEGFVRWTVEKQSQKHNMPTLKAKDDFHVWHLFLYLYAGWFAWYGLLGMVYVPFGSTIQDLQELVLGPKYVNEWVPEAISMDTAMITPLIVTQGLNLLLDTLIPWLVRKMTKEYLLEEGGLTLGDPIATIDDLSVVEHKAVVEGKDGEADNLVDDSTSTRQLVEAIKADSDMGNSVYFIESMPTWDRGTGEKKGRLVRKWKSSKHLMEESEDDDFNFFSEMLDPAIQFSYIVNFSAIWPMCALCGYLNNYMEVISDAGALVLYGKRPIPRMVNGLGSWVNALQFAMVLGVLFTVGMITVASSGLEAWSHPELCGIEPDDFHMSPSVGCMGGGGSYRLTTILVMEHFGLLVCFAVWTSIGAKSKELKEETLQGNLKRKKMFEKHWLSSASASV